MEPKHAPGNVVRIRRMFRSASPTNSVALAKVRCPEGWLEASGRLAPYAWPPQGIEQVPGWFHWVTVMLCGEGHVELNMFSERTFLGF